MRVHDKMKRTIYAMYRGEEFIDVGTKKEIMKRQNLRSETFNFYNTKTYHKRIANKEDNRIIIIKVGVLKK